MGVIVLMVKVCDLDEGKNVDIWYIFINDVFSIYLIKGIIMFK